MIEKVAPGIYRVPSDSDFGKTYVVDLTGPEKSCTCTAYSIDRNKVKAGARQRKPQAVTHGQSGWCKHLDSAIYESERDEDAQRTLKENEDAKAAEEFERIKTIASLKATMKELEE
jgi:hypothetical protein